MCGVALHLTPLPPRSYPAFGLPLKPCALLPTPRLQLHQLLLRLRHGGLGVLAVQPAQRAQAAAAEAVGACGAGVWVGGWWWRAWCYRGAARCWRRAPLCPHWCLRRRVHGRTGHGFRHLHQAAVSICPTLLASHSHFPAPTRIETAPLYSTCLPTPRNPAAHPKPLLLAATPP